MTTVAPRPVRSSGRYHNPGPAALIAAGERSYSFEFFPPKTGRGEHTLWQALGRVEAVGPAFVSVAYGAGGSSRERTAHATELAQRLLDEDAPGLHYITLNHSTAALDIHRGLSLPKGGQDDRPVRRRP